MSLHNFVSPHCHQHSLDSASRPEDFIEREIELGTGHTVVTDHGSLAACRKVYDLAKEASLTPILGLESYFRDDNDDILIKAGIPKTYYDIGKDPEKAALYPNGTFKDHIKYHHLTMHFQDQKAYECVVKLLSKADDRAERHGSERKPLFNWAQLEEIGSHNVTFGSSCLIGMVSRHLLAHEDLDTAIKYYERLRSFVKPGNFIVEIFPHKCNNNWVQGTFLTMTDGTKLKFHGGKKLRTDIAEEITAEELARQWNLKDNKHKFLLAVKNYSVWKELPPVQIENAAYIEDFLANEPCEWAPDGDVQAGVNRALIALAERYGDPLVVSDDCHFANESQRVIQEVRLAQSGNWKFSESYHRMDSKEALAKFRNSLDLSPGEFEKWVDNSHEWASKFKDFKFVSEPSLPVKFYEVNYPKYEWFENADKNDHSLMYTLELIRKHGRMDWNNKEWTARLEREIELFHNNGTIDLLPYNFVIEELCEYYEKQGLLPGPGRGSAAGCALAYLLGITHVDPIKNDLSLDRFLTLDRIKSGKFPDVDVDFPNRDLLMDPETGYLTKRFGDHFAQISVDTTLKCKACVRDVSRYLRGHVPYEIEVLTKKFILPPQGVGDFDFIMGYSTDAGEVQGSIAYDPALKDYIAQFPKDWEIVKMGLSQTKNKGRHASAILIANRPISDFIPMTTVSDVKVTAYTANAVEAVGGLKYDLLVVNSLADLSDAIRLAQAQAPLNPKDLGYAIIEHEEALIGWGGPKFTDKRFSVILNGKRVPCSRLVPFNSKLYDVWDLPYSKDTYKDIIYGKTQETVFQLSTPSATQWMRKFEGAKVDGSLCVNSIRDIAIFTSLDRPGPLDYFVKDPYDPNKKHNMLVEYANRIKGEVSSPDILPVFDELLPELNGVMLTQESMQKVYQNLTGCTGPEAEAFRSDVAKKKKAKIEKAYSFFIEKASANIGEENAKAVWEAFIPWSSYGFCYSHAFSYGSIAYATAFIKHHYPLQWWCAVLKNASKNDINEKFWRHCGHLIKNPDLKASGDFFEIHGDHIQAPLDLLHGIGAGAHKQLCEYRPYTDIRDFCEKLEAHKVKNGRQVTKTVKKTRTIKAKDSPTGVKYKEQYEVQVEAFKKGSSAINRKTVYTLIISGAMDDMFPKVKVIEGVEYPFTFFDQLEEFERLLAETSGARKVQAPDTEYLTINPLQRYQLKKGILPAYNDDLSKLFSQMKVNGVFSRDNDVFYKYKNRLLKFVGPDELELLDSNDMPDGQPIMVAMGAYIEDSRPFVYQTSKQACEVLFDVNGGRFKYVKWPDWNTETIPATFHATLKGSLGVVILNKYKADKPFGLEDLVIVENPRTEKEDKDDTE